jgi:NAD(P)-dependent dehydrogenase (short-subunit alcohol dehydrogenase family)
MRETSAPISKKAPGDRQLSFEEIGRFSSLIMGAASEGKVADLPPSALKEIASVLRKRKPPAFLASIDPSTAKTFGSRIARTLEKGEVRLRVVDLGEKTGFPRENARPVYEVLLVDRGGKLLWEGKKGLLSGGGATATIFLTSALLEKTRSRPLLLLQTILHPVLEWILGFPHMVAVLCESAYNASPPGPEADEVSDLNRFIAVEAGRERDFAYFDRILGTSYEPDEFRMEELHARFGPDEAKTAEIVSRARAMGTNYRKLVEGILTTVKEEIAREAIAQARKALDEGDSERALTCLRKLLADPGTEGRIREEAGTLVGMAIRSYALDTDPAYEGLRMENGEIRVDALSGRKAKEFAQLLNESIGVVRTTRDAMGQQAAGEEGTDPLGKSGVPRIIHVIPDLERPSAKFIDGHDRVHWVFAKAFAEALLSGRASGRAPLGIPAIMACRFVRDGAFPDEKLKIDRQFAVAVKGAVEGYRFYQALPASAREEMAAFHDASGMVDPLYRLFLSLGEETHPARASHLIRRAVARTHSYNYVRYPETPLAGKVIVITGGGTGMGRALALEAAIQGANVVITGRRPHPLEETKADTEDLIRHLGLTNQILIVQGDVSDPKYVGEMFDRIEREFGRIDVLYNNAGVSGPVEFGSVYQEEHFEEYREAVGIHLTGSWLASLEAARVMENQPGGGVIVMVGTFYSESIHRHVLHAYPGRLPYTSAQSAKLALGDYLAWMLAEKNITVLSLNPAAVSTDRIQRGAGVFDKGSRARARVGRKVSPEALERDTLDRTVGREFVLPRDFARVALELQGIAFRRTEGGQRIPLGGVTYEQPPGIFPSPAVLSRHPDMVGKIALVTLHHPKGSDISLFEASVRALGRAGASMVLAGGRSEDLDRLSLQINSAGGEGMATVYPVNLGNPSEVQELFDGLPRIDLLLHFTGSVDWKRPLTAFPFEDWTATVDQFGYVPRLLCWQAERRMDRDGVDGTIVIVGPDLSGVPSIRERNLVQVFQAMLRPAVATESMERALMRKSQAEGTSPSHVSEINIGLILPGRTDGRNKQADPARTAASVLWLLDEGKKVSGAALLPDEQNSIARLPEEPKAMPGSMAGKVVAVTGGIRNLGKEISLRFAAEKATVVIASRRPSPAGLTGEEAGRAKADLGAADASLSAMRSLGARSLWIDVDVSRPQKVRALIEETRNRFGRIDAFVNNAGAGGDFSLIGDVLREHRKSWDAVLRSNFLGPWHAISLLRDVMRKQEEGGVIVNVSTHYADHPYLFRTIYTVSKILLKSLTQALRDTLAADNIVMADVAPSLIAGPRMDWVMRNYAVKFAEQFERIPGMPAAEARSLQDLFVRSFDRSLPPDKRDRAASSFLSAVGASRLPRAARAQMESWYARALEWFRSTVPDAPPTNGQVADAVLFGVKNARFLEDRFLGVTTLPPFTSFPPVPAVKKRSLAGETFLLLSVGASGNGTSVASSFAASLARSGARVISLRESPTEPGRVDITRPAKETGRGAGTRSPETLSRELDVSDPRILEPWLDNSLLGGPSPAGAILILGTTAADRSFLGFSPEEKENFLSHLSKSLSVFAESTRAVQEDGHVVVVMPPPSTEEGQVMRAAARQMVRTSLAEQHFLFLGKPVRLSLLTSPGGREDRDFLRNVADILSGQAAPEIEPVPLGRPRP